MDLSVEQGSKEGEEEKIEEVVAEEIHCDGDSNQSQESKMKSSKKMKNIILKRTELLENSLDMLTKLFPNKKRSVLELVLKRCGDDLIKAIEEIVPKTMEQTEGGTPEKEPAKEPDFSEISEKAKKKFDNLLKHRLDITQTNKNLLFFHEGQSSAFKPVVSKFSEPEDANFLKLKKSENSIKDINRNVPKCMNNERLQKTQMFNHLITPPNAHLNVRPFGQTNLPYNELNPEFLRPNNFNLPFAHSSISLPFGHNSISTALFALGGPSFNFGCSLNNFPNFNNGIAIPNQGLNNFPGLNNFNMLSNLAGQGGGLCPNDFLMQLPNANLEHLKRSEEFCRVGCEKNGECKERELMCPERGHVCVDDVNIQPGNMNEVEE